MVAIAAFDAITLNPSASPSPNLGGRGENEVTGMDIPALKLSTL
jgi:hypothetical protein